MRQKIAKNYSCRHVLMHLSQNVKFFHHFLSDSIAQLIKVRQRCCSFEGPEINGLGKYFLKLFEYDWKIFIATS